MSTPSQGLPVPPADRAAIRTTLRTLPTYTGLVDDRFAELRKHGEIYSFKLPGSGRLISRFLPRVTNRIVLIHSPRLVRAFFAQPKGTTDLDTGKEPLRYVMGSESSLLLGGEKHRFVRQGSAPALTRSAVETYRDIMVEEIDRELDVLPLGVPVAMRDVFGRINRNIILRTLLGVTDPAEIKRLEQTILDGIATAASVQSFFRLLALQLFAPKDDDQIPRWIWPKGRRIRDAADADIYRLIAERRIDPGVYEGAMPVVSEMLRQYVNDDRWTDKIVRDQLVTMAMAGHETTATLAGWAVERVTRHPDVSAKLTAEARGGTSADYAHAVSTETLRLRPPVVGGGGSALRDFDLAEYRIRAGTAVFISYRALHADPDLYPQPDQFRPERFLENPPELFGWLPFGAGHHRCPGMHLALLESDLTLQRVFGRLTLQPVGKPERSSVRASFLNQPARGAQVVVTHRLAADEVPVYRPGREGCPDGAVGRDECPVTISDGEG